MESENYSYYIESLRKRIIFIKNLTGNNMNIIYLCN
jgi:hypothetical protein